MATRFDPVCAQYITILQAIREHVEIMEPEERALCLADLGRMLTAIELTCDLDYLQRLG